MAAWWRDPFGGLFGSHESISPAAPLTTESTTPEVTTAAENRLTEHPSRSHQGFTSDLIASPHA
jgi:hypothetical protein